MKKLVLLTGNELRHEFFRKYIAIQKNINVLSTYCESEKDNLVNQVQKDKNENKLRSIHLEQRKNTENDFFGVFCKTIEDKSNPIFIERGEINKKTYVNNIRDLNPDIIISYGCSIIKSDLINTYKGRFINIHLGLSPYYRGSGTNFWPFVNKELQFVGTTFMYIDEGIDTGKIIHQIRANFNVNDNIHQVGNRLIKDSVIECFNLIKHFDSLVEMQPIIQKTDNLKYYRKKDFSENSINIAYDNVENGMIRDYLKNKPLLDSKFKIINNQAML